MLFASMGTSSDVKVSQMQAVGECWVSNGLNEHLNGAKEVAG